MYFWIRNTCCFPRSQGITWPRCPCQSESGGNPRETIVWISGDGGQQIDHWVPDSWLQFHLNAPGEFRYFSLSQPYSLHLSTKWGNDANLLHWLLFFFWTRFPSKILGGKKTSRKDYIICKLSPLKNSWKFSLKNYSGGNLEAIQGCSVSFLQLFI